MPSFPVASEKQLHLVDSSLSTIETLDGDVRLGLTGANIHYDDYLESHEATLVVSGASFANHVDLPSEVLEASLQASDGQWWGVFLPLPFSIAQPCQVKLLLGSGDVVLVSGLSFHVELGPGVRHNYSFEPHNGT